MIQSFKYTFISLKNTKGFLFSMLVMPIFMVVLISLTLAYSGVPVVGLVKGEYSGEFKLASVKVKELEENEIDYFLGSSEGTLVLSLESKGNIEKYRSSIDNNPLIQTVKEGQGKDEISLKPKVSYSLGVILFKLLTGASLTATIIIQERQNGIFIRLRNAKVSKTAHLLGKAAAVFLVYEIANIALLAFYHFAGFDFGESSPFSLGMLFTITLIISTGIYIFVASFIENEGYLWLFSTGLLFPLALLSGALFPIETMPSWMKKLAHISPQYYLQKAALLGEWLNPSLMVLLFISLILLWIGIERNFKKD